MPRPSPRARADAVDPQLLAERAPLLHARRLLVDLLRHHLPPRQNRIPVDTTPTSPRWPSGNRGEGLTVARERLLPGFVRIPEARGQSTRSSASRPGGREGYGSGGSQDDAGTIRGRERGRRARKSAACASGRGVREEEGGDGLGFGSPRRKDGQTHRTLAQGPLYHRERGDEGCGGLGYGQQGFLQRRVRGAARKAAAYIENLEEIYVVDANAGADPRYSLNVHVVTEHAWQALFARQLFRRPSREELDAFEPDWTVISVPGLLTDPEEDGTESETF